jgi:hypothetical protein
VRDSQNVKRPHGPVSDSAAHCPERQSLPVRATVSKYSPKECFTINTGCASSSSSDRHGVPCTIGQPVCQWKSYMASHRFTMTISSLFLRSAYRPHHTQPPRAPFCEPAVGEPASLGLGGTCWHQYERKQSDDECEAAFDQEKVSPARFAIDPAHLENSCCDERACNAT